MTNDEIMVTYFKEYIKTHDVDYDSGVQETANHFEVSEDDVWLALLLIMSGNLDKLFTKN